MAPLGHELPFVLLGAFRRVIDELHEELATQGFGDLRPAHAVALRAMDPDGSTATQIAERVGVSKQAIAKTINILVGGGYVDRQPNPTDRRAHLILVTGRGARALSLSGEILQQIARRQADLVGEDNLATTLEVLRNLRSDSPDFEKFGQWFGHE